MSILLKPCDYPKIKGGDLDIAVWANIFSDSRDLILVEREIICIADALRELCHTTTVELNVNTRELELYSRPAIELFKNKPTACIETYLVELFLKKNLLKRLKLENIIMIAIKEIKLVSLISNS